MPASLSNAACGSYILREAISAGATAEVYRATHRDDASRSFAAKVMRAERARDPGTVDAFKAEFAMLQRLAHPGLPKGIKLGDIGGRPTMIIGYFGGRTVAHLMAKNQLQQPGRIFVRIAEIVAYLHREMVVHNDLKPENLIVHGDNAVALIDFGNARDYGKTTFFQRLFRRPPSSVFATPTYVAPEVLAGKSPKPYSDIFSLGVMAHVLFAGSPPWKPGLERQGQAPPLQSRAAHVPAAVARVIDLCLVADPAHRIPDGGHLVQALAPLIQMR